MGQVPHTQTLFRKFVALTSDVHQAQLDLTQGIRPDAVTPVQYGILEYLAVNQPVTLSEISECKHMSMPNTSRELRKLTEKRLCEKFDSPGDRRKTYIRLTDEGQALMNDTFGRIEVRFRHWLKDLSAEDLDEIEQALDVLQAKVFK